MPTERAIREQVQRISKSPYFTFHVSEKTFRLGELFQYVVGEFLTGKPLTGKSIGEGFYGWKLSAADPEPADVKVNMGKIKARLRDYYGGIGAADLIYIDFPERGYEPIIRGRLDTLCEKSRKSLRRAVEAREKRNANGYSEAIRVLNEIPVEECERNPIVFGRLAEIHALRVLHSVVRPRPEMEIARDYARRALEKSQNVWAAHVAEGAYEACINWNWRKATESFSRAIAIGGQHVKTLPWSLTMYNAQNYGDDLIEFLEDYICELGDPGPLIRRNLATALMLVGRFEDAIREYESALPHYLAHMYLVMVHDAMGEPEKALEHARLGSQKPGSQYRAPGLLIMALAKAGYRDEARKELALLENRRDYLSRFELAVAHMGFAQYDQVLDYLEQARDEREYLMLFLPNWPMFRALHHEQRFLDIVHDMHLPDPRP
jgi:hypothetical protein